MRLRFLGQCVRYEAEADFRTGSFSGSGKGGLWAIAHSMSHCLIHCGGIGSFGDKVSSAADGRITMSRAMVCRVLRD